MENRIKSSEIESKNAMEGVKKFIDLRTRIYAITFLAPIYTFRVFLILFFGFAPFLLFYIFDIIYLCYRLYFISARMRFDRTNIFFFFTLYAVFFNKCKVRMLFKQKIRRF